MTTSRWARWLTSKISPLYTSRTRARHPSADAGHDPSHTPNRPAVQRLRFGVGSLAAVPLAQVLVFTMHESSRTGAQRRPYLMPVQRHSTAQAVAACLARSRTWPRFDPCNALLVSMGKTRIWCYRWDHRSVAEQAPLVVRPSLRRGHGTCLFVHGYVLRHT